MSTENSVCNFLENQISYTQFPDKDYHHHDLQTYRIPGGDINATTEICKNYCNDREDCGGFNLKFHPKFQNHDENKTICYLKTKTWPGLDGKGHAACVGDSGCIQHNYKKDKINYKFNTPNNQTDLHEKVVILNKEKNLCKEYSKTPRKSKSYNVTNIFGDNQVGYIAIPPYSNVSLCDYYATDDAKKCKPDGAGGVNINLKADPFIWDYEKDKPYSDKNKGLHYKNFDEFIIHDKEERKDFTPEEISSMILAQMKVAMPEVAMPEVAMPEVAMPEVAMPEVAMPVMGQTQNTKHKRTSKIRNYYDNNWGTSWITNFRIYNL